MRKSFEFAEEKHAGQKRLSGDPYITHPLAVANILADLEQDPVSISAALLHDVIEESGVSPEEIGERFGDTVRKLVEGVTKLGHLAFENKEESQAESFRKMFLAMGEDVRVILVKLCDRLHNMQTLEFLPIDRQHHVALETRDIYAPLANRLGIGSLKWALEDLAFRYLEEEKYLEIKKNISQKRLEREKYVEDFKEKVREALHPVKIQAEIQGRPKHFFSIYHKMVDQNLSFDDLYDILAVRIIVDSVKDCYAVLGVIHAYWKPIPGKFDDYIAVPKSNGYQSLHTTIIGPEGRPIEIQIRTSEMHQVSEFGVAAHWRYKEGGLRQKVDQKMTWLRQLLEDQKDIKGSRDFMESLKTELFADEVFVFSPKGDVFSVPLGSTPIDFAYRIHTEIGHSCSGVRVNGKIESLDTKLKNGDIVEIIRGKHPNPKLDWLNFARTHGARTRIKSWFKKLHREENIAAGREALEREIRGVSLPISETLTDEKLGPYLSEWGAHTLEDLFASMGQGDHSAYAIAKRIQELLFRKGGPAQEIVLPPLDEKPRRKFPPQQSVRVAGMEGILVRFSKCCNPIPGEDIVGHVTKGKGVAVHRVDCPNIVATAPDPGKLLKVEWSFGQDNVYPVALEIEAFDRVGVLKDILEKIAETTTNVRSANVRSKRGSSAIVKLTLDVRNVEHFRQVLGAIRKVNDVYDAYRSEGLRTLRSGE